MHQEETRDKTQMVTTMIYVRFKVTICLYLSPNNMAKSIGKLEVLKRIHQEKESVYLNLYTHLHNVCLLYHYQLHFQTFIDITDIFLMTKKKKRDKRSLSVIFALKVLIRSSLTRGWSNSMDSKVLV